MNLIVIAGLASAVLVAAVLLGWRLVTALSTTMAGVREVSTECLAQMQINQARVLKKMEDWHEEDIRAARGHLERILETREAGPQAVVVGKQHALERHEEHVTSATHSTNERMADLHEATASLAAAGEPTESLKPERTEVQKSKALRTREKLVQGEFPERHR